MRKKSEKDKKKVKQGNTYMYVKKDKKVNRLQTWKK